MSTRGKPQLVEIEEQLLKAVKEEAKRRGITYRAFFEAGLRAELARPSVSGSAHEELRIA
ncbi:MULTISPECIES: hypothetical protein [unclassified Nocardia]|uniref:hypothetical protein n=1 Tax=unclassified Nocardia TaxID=2637762 RepID=UPI00278BFFDE|nr:MULTISPECIES: hypothetical protein [unclassified Nocardia]